MHFMRKRFAALGLACVVALSGAVAVPVPAYAETPVVLPEGGVAWKEGKTVYYKDESSKPAGDKDYTGQYATMVDALNAVYQSNPEQPATLYCKPKADVGRMTHGHVGDSLTIYGNDAYVSSGERDLEFDTWKYDRTTGKQGDSGAFLDEDVSVVVKGLDGIAAWGQRNTGHAITLAFEDCQDMQRVYFTNSNNMQGKINITLDGCSFDGARDGVLVANVGTAVYSNSDGDISIKNTSFNEIAVALNMNHKAAGTQNISLESCTFTNCATDKLSADQKTTTYGAPVRVVSKKGAITNLEMSNCSFVYSDGMVNCGNGDILIGDGRHSADVEQGVVTLAMNGTDADVMVQKAGYFAEDGKVANAEQGTLTEIPADAIVTPDEGGHFEVDLHDVTKVVNAKAATCTSEGYTGDTVCAKCGKVLEKGKVIAKVDHDAGDWQSDAKEHWHVCTNEGCGVEFDRSAHTFGDWNVVKEATAETSGSKERVCTACGHKETVELPKLEKPAKPEKPEEPATGGKDETGKKPALPQTGDVAPLMALAASVSGATALAAGLFSRKRR